MIARMCLNIIISVKILLNNKLRLILTITGMSLGLLLVVSGIEIINAYTEKEYKKVECVDENVVMLHSNGEINLSEALYELKRENCEYSYSYYKKALDLSSNGYLYNDSRIDYNLGLLAASYDFQKGYICFDDDENNYCGKINLLYGKKISKSQYNDKENVCILEESTSELMFGCSNSVGEFIDIEINSNKYRFEIVGIIEDMPTTSINNLEINSSIYTNSDIITNRDVIVPLTWYNHFYKNAERSECYVMFYFSDNTKELGKSLLEKMDYKTDNIEFVDYNSLSEALQEFSGFLQSIVSILLLCIFMIAGLIVMNTLFFSIKERISEIGIRRALGAKSADIILQIMVESIIQGLIAFIFTIVIVNVLFATISYICIYIAGIDFVLSIHKKTYLVLLVLTLIESIVFSLLPGIYATRIKTTEAINFS